MRSSLPRATGRSRSSPPEVQAEDPDIHLSTIYRNLEELERLGVVVHSHFGHGPATYHLASSVHGHFVCEQCGTLIEAPDSFFDGLTKAAPVDLRVHHRPASLCPARTLRQLPLSTGAGGTDHGRWFQLTTAWTGPACARGCPTWPGRSSDMTGKMLASRHSGAICDQS